MPFLKEKTEWMMRGIWEDCVSISAKGSTVSKEERFRSAHGNEEDFFEMYRDDFDDDEEAEDAFYEEMEDDEF